MSSQDSYLKNASYLQNARDAQDWADRAATKEDREGWLKVARGWMSLIKRSSDLPESRPHRDEFSPSRTESRDRSKTER